MVCLRALELLDLLLSLRWDHHAADSSFCTWKSVAGASGMGQLCPEGSYESSETPRPDVLE